MSKTLDKLLEDYISLIEANAKNLEKGRIRKANKYSDKLIKTFQKLKQFGEEGHKAIYTLLNHDNLYVQKAAAANLIRIYTKEAEKVLENMIDEPGVGFIAETFLEEWREGNLNDENYMF